MPGGEELRGHAVCGDHEVVDELGGAVLSIHIETVSIVAVEHGPRANGVEAERAVLAPARAQALGHSVLQPQVLVQAGHAADWRRHGALAVKPGRHAVVGQRGMIANARAVDVGVLHRAVGIHLHLDHDGQPNVAGVQRREIGRRVGRVMRRCQPGRGIRRRVVPRGPAPRTPAPGPVPPWPARRWRAARIDVVTKGAAVVTCAATLAQVTRRLSPRSCEIIAFPGRPACARRRGSRSACCSTSSWLRGRRTRRCCRWRASWSARPSTAA